MENFSPETPYTPTLLNTDAATDEQMVSAAKWARFVAIVFIVFASLFILMALFFVINIDTITNELVKINGVSDDVIEMLEKGGNVAIGAVMIISALVLGVNGMFLLQFGNRALRYIHSRDHIALNESFTGLRKYLYLSYILGIISAVISVLSTFTFFLKGL